MRRLAQTRAPDTLAQTLNRVATLEAEVKELKRAVRLLLQVDPVLEARMQALEAHGPVPPATEA